MKNLIKILSLLLVMSAVMFVACNKYSVLVEENNANSQLQLRTYSFNADIKKIETGLDEYGILSFDNKESYLETLEQLERLSNEFNAEITDFEDENLNYYQVLFDFSKQINFHSLFVDIYNKEEKWLEETDGSDINEDPDNHFVTDYYERSLYNMTNEVVVADKIYKKLETGHLIINSLNFDILKELRNNLDIQNLPEGVEYIGDLPVVEIENGRVMAVCDGSKRNTAFKFTGEDFKIKWVIEINTPIFDNRNVKATTHNYQCTKYKSNGKCKRWSKRPAITTSTVSGSVSGDANCGVMLGFNTVSWTLSRTFLLAKQDVSTRTRSGFVNGYHAGINGITHNSTLTW